MQGHDAAATLGAKNVLDNGQRVRTRAGEALQAYGVNYILTDPRNRLHLSRSGAIRYLCRELRAYFFGSLRVADGLSQASTFWETLQDANGNINSNYGYHVFYEPVEGHESQYDWVINRIIENQDTRRAIININQTYHKSETLDFPCAIAIQFYVRRSYLFCEVSARSTDIVTGLPYDMGFFSFLHELTFCDLRERGLTTLELGSTVIKASFTQIYDRTFTKAIRRKPTQSKNMSMPRIESARAVLDDIYRGSTKTTVADWIARYAE